jgi:DNA-binding transcriptional LysR family regulator
VSDDIRRHHIAFKAGLIDSCGPDSAVGIATGYGLDGPGIESRWGARFFAPVQTGPGVQPASCTMGTGSFPGVKSGRGVTLTPHPLLVPWSRKGRAIPLLPLWAVRPVQSLIVCTKVHFTCTF